MNEFEYKTLLEKRWRQQADAGEEARVRAWLAQHPESKADWDLETHLAEGAGRVAARAGAEQFHGARAAGH